ncbi:hypothetical protein ASPFODRAFT_35594 [Aspergillus luchuensis CBS 106.47]|uniref:Uncharacterized protein n=1 Tax=Aspergillus luchuensis (strain CBS 106.47) TaxID=1137211 RepID=A0A1M3T8E8_ASPLC|nr:hypothetical protein ASPFODRAFT_35594 [Aspergillus luchuensis CBS 106.47]
MGLSINDSDDLDPPVDGEPQLLDNVPDQTRREELHGNFGYRRILSQISIPRTNLIGLPLSKSGLLQTYVDEIVPRILCTPEGFRNPFVQDVLPIAFSDMLVMNAVLAVGGSTRDVGHPVSRAEEKEVLQYYGQAIRELKLELTKWTAGTPGEWEAVRLFLTVLLLSHYEIIRGNKKGHLFHHIRAARVFAPTIHTFKDGQWSALVGVLLENYIYFELCSSLRLVPDQIDIDAAAQYVVPQLESLRELNTWGVMFGGASEIYKLVPDICELALRRKEQLATTDDLHCEETYQNLKAAITGWVRDADDDDGLSVDDTFSQGKIAAEIIAQNALFLFLVSSYLQDRDQEYLRQISGPLVDAMIELAPILRKTPFANTTFWPIIVTASYATTKAQRKSIVEYLPVVMPVVARALEVLQWIWDDPEGDFGLLGMAKVIESHQTSYCFG